MYKTKRVKNMSGTTNSLLVFFKHAIFEHGHLEIIIAAQQLIEATLCCNPSILEENDL